MDREIEKTRREKYVALLKGMEEVRLGRTPELTDEEFVNTLIRQCNRFSENQLEAAFVQWVHQDEEVSNATLAKRMLQKYGDLLEAICEQKELDMVEAMADIVLYCYILSHRCSISLDAIVCDQIQHHLQQHIRDGEGF